MATFKHISSKNANYGDAEKYLTFAHDEFTMKPTLDADGRLVPREDYRISTLNCGEEDFAVACMRANLRYGKNQKREDVKSHHYIISFDPRDGPDNGLTVDKAQELGEKFCREQFPGHQAIVCTHPDGHNQSGNIHVHIVINSLRIENVPLLPYMDRHADTKAGCKHRCTDAAMEYFKSEVMELCHEAGLYQIDLLNGSANRVTEREYWAKKKGQAALDQENAALAAEGKPTKPTRFETDKEKLRQIIRKTLNESFTVEDFTRKLLQYGVTVKESRGRFSYLTPDRTKPITARKLGDSFDKAAVLAALEQNTLRPENTLTLNDGIPLDRTLSSNEGASGKTAPKQSVSQAPSVGRMVDREAKRAEGKGIGYDRWATMHNLKAWSKTFMYLQEHDLLSPDKLSAAVDAAGAEAREARSRYDAAAVKVTDKKAMLEAMDNYRKTYPVIKEYRAIRKEKDKQKLEIGRQSNDINGDVSNRRFAIWGSGLEIFKSKPLTGVTFRNYVPYAEDKLPDTYIVHNDFDKFRSMHNSFVDILVSQGILGVVIIAAYIILVLVLIFKNFFKFKGEKYKYHTVLLSIIAPIFASMMFYSETFYMNTGGAFLFWLALGYLIQSVTSKNSEAKEITPGK